VIRARVAISALSLSAAALVGLAVHEGYTDRAVRPLPGDVPTVGFGTTRRPDGTPVQMGDTTAPVPALQAKLRDVRQFEGELRGCVTAPLHQHEYDALVRWAYNVGPAAACSSTLVRLTNAGRYAEACAQYDRWTYFQGRDCRDPANRCSGLVTRRAEERALCEGRGVQ
jgi:lysozyme